jgi:hypothetical protein
MSLPERKKSAAEIARLRESLGVPAASAGEGGGSAPTPGDAAAPVDTIVPASHQATVVHTPETVPLSPQPEPDPGEPAKPVHSLKRSERRPPPQNPPAQSGDGTGGPGRFSGANPDSVSPQPRSMPDYPRPGRSKPIRSLRKSEQAPPAAGSQPEPPPDSKLPHHRHSDKEIQEIRRREALALMNSAPNPLLFPAHPALIIPGYVTALGAAVGFYFYEFHLLLTVALILASLGFAAYIFLKKPISRHHAAFIAVLSLFVLVFAALHYFPQLRHAT